MRHLNKNLSLRTDNMLKGMVKENQNDIEKVKNGKIKFDDVRWCNITSKTIHKTLNF